MVLLKLTVIFTIFSAVHAQNYCARELCNGRQHIACNNNGRWARDCVGRTIDVQPHIKLILSLHNERRNRVAAGQLPRFPSAVQMATMSWDPELARIASYNALRCRMQHDDCRNTNSFRYAGQNLSILYSRNVDIATFLRQRIESWFNEHCNATRSDLECYRPRSASSKQIGHFTVMVNEKNNGVGCAISQFTSSNRVQAIYLVCNYAVTNVVNNPIYRFGRPASQCRTGRNQQYTSLCSKRETYNHNQWQG